MSKKLATVAALWIMALPLGASGEQYRGFVVAVESSAAMKVVRVDTGVPSVVRIHGIDVPEIGQRFGKEARSFAESLALEKVVLVETVETDDKGRIVANITLPDGSRLAPLLLKDGWAWWYRKTSPDNEFFKALEHQARVRRIGLWRDRNPVPPWEWREAVKLHHPQMRRQRTGPPPE